MMTMTETPEDPRTKRAKSRDKLQHSTKPAAKEGLDYLLDSVTVTVADVPRFLSESLRHSTQPQILVTIKQLKKWILTHV